MDDDIAHQLDSFSLNEEESIYAKFSNTEVESKQEACEHSTFLVIYGGGVINALGFKTAMLRPWQCEGYLLSYIHCLIMYSKSSFHPRLLRSMYLNMSHGILIISLLTCIYGVEILRAL